MNNRTHSSNRRRLIGSVEALDQRVLLTTVPVAPVTPVPSNVQSISLPPAVSSTVIQAFQTDMARLNDEFIGQAQALVNLLIARIDHYQGLLVSGATSSSTRVERALEPGAKSRILRTPAISPLFNAEFAHQEAFFNTKAIRLTFGFENQMSALSSEFEQASTLFAAPALQFDGNIQAASTAFSNEISGALTSVATTFSNGSAALNALLRNPATATTGAGVLPGSEVFGSAFTQLLGAVTTDIEGVTSGLQQTFGSFQTQFGASVSSLMASFAASPLGSSS